MDTNATNRTFLRIWTLVTARMQGQSSNDSELEDLLSQGDVFNDTIKSERANHRSSVEEALMYIALIIMIIIIITGATGENLLNNIHQIFVLIWNNLITHQTNF